MGEIATFGVLQVPDSHFTCRGLSLKKQEQLNSYFSGPEIRLKETDFATLRSLEEIQELGRSRAQLEALDACRQQVKRYYGTHFKDVVPELLKRKIPTTQLKLIDRLTNPEYLGSMLQDFCGKNTRFRLSEFGPNKSEILQHLSNELKASLIHRSLTLIEHTREEG